VKRIMTLIAGVFGMAVFFLLAGPVSAGDITNLAGDMPTDPIGGITGMAILVNATAINGLFTSLKATFNKAFAGAESQWKETAMLVPSTTKQNDYAWLSNFPKMRKWIGDKVVKALSAFSYTIVNEDFEATVEVDRNDIKDDDLGIYGIQAQDAGMSAKELPDEIVTELKDKAFESECFDGQYFYDTDHVVAGASISNKLTVPLSAASVAAAKASWGAAKDMMAGFTDDEGRPLGLRPNILEVGSALEETAKLLATGDKLEDDSPNPYKGTIKVVVNDRLLSGTQWMAHCTKRAVKPFVYQEREKPSFVSQTNMDSDDVFMRKKYKFGAEARAAGGYGLWQLSVGSTGAG